MPLNLTIVQGPFQPVPPVTGGAVEKLWFDLGREFARRGLSVTHVSRRFAGLPDAETLDGVTHRRIASFSRPNSRVREKLMDLVYSMRCLRALPPADIVVTNTFFLPMLMSLLPRGRRIVYVSVHRYPQGQMRFYGRVDRLQCVSTAVADAVKAQAPAVAPLVKVVPNYVSSWRDPAAVAASWTERRRDVLFVGRIHPEKGIDLLLRAFAAVPMAVRQGWRLAVVGPHEGTSGGGGVPFFEGLKRLATELQVDVEWIGLVSDRAALNEIYARSRIFVYPSTAAKGEALPLAPLEAMSQGCPVVTSDLLCFTDYLKPGVNGDSFALAGGRQVDKLAATLAALIPDDARQRRYSAEGTVTVQDFTLARIADTFIDDFNHLHLHRR